MAKFLGKKTGDTPNGSTAITSTSAAVVEEKPEHNKLNFIWNAFLAFMLTVITAVCFVVFILPIILGAVPSTILTPSMKPALDPGDLVYVKPVDIKEIGIGDVVMVQPKSGDPETITHRVIGINLGDAKKNAIVTAGDNNNGVVDPAWRAEQIRGKVIYSVPKVGWIRQYPQIGWGAVALLLGYFIISLFLPSKEDRERKKVEQRNQERLAALEAELARRDAEEAERKANTEKTVEPVVTTDEASLYDDTTFNNDDSSALFNDDTEKE